MPCIEKEPIHDMCCIRRRQYERFLNIHFLASMSGVVLGGVVEVVGSNLARGKIFTAQLIHFCFGIFLKTRISN